MIYRSTMAGRKQFAFSLFELLIVIAIIAVLAALFLPALSRANASAKLAVCKNNLKQVGLGLILFVEETGVYPHPKFSPSVPRPGWGAAREPLLPYCANVSKVFRCPSERTDYKLTSYAYNHSGTDFSGSMFPSNVERLNLGLSGELRLPDHSREASYEKRNRPLAASRVQVPSEMIAFGHFAPFSIVGFGWPGIRYAPRAPHQLDPGLFCDGHVESSNPARIRQDPQKPWTFVPDEPHARRWNNDYQPHPETWHYGPVIY